MEIEHTFYMLRKKAEYIASKASNDDDSKIASNHVRRLNGLIRRTMSKLATINDSTINNFIRWEKSKKGQNQSTKKPCTPEEKEALPLDMICTNESDSEDESESEMYEMEPSDFRSKYTDLLRNFQIFKKRYHEDRGTGNDNPILPVHKGIQVDDVENRDYEKCIGHALLMKAEFNPKTNKEMLIPVKVPDENFGKYEEQYVFHLQHIEDHGIVTDEYKGLPDPNETPLKELIEANSPFISEMLESIGTATLTNGSCREIESIIVPETLPKSKSKEKSNSEAVDNLAEIVTKLSNDIGVDDDDEKMDVEESMTNVDETVIAVQALIEDGDSMLRLQDQPNSDKPVHVITSDDDTPL